MSDYEGEDWDPVSSSSHEPTIQSDAFATQAVPHALPDPAESGRIRPSPPHMSTRPRRRIRIDSEFHPKIQQIQLQSFSRSAARHTTSPASSPSKSDKSVSLQRSRQYPQAADHEYVMSKSWAELLKTVSNSKSSASTVVRQQLDAICASSEAYIASPTDNTNRLLIWGTREQCSRAVAQLDAWQMSLQSRDRSSRDPIWQKSQAYDGRREHRRMQESYTAYTNQLFREADDSDFGFEAYLLWPSEYDLDAYLNSFEATAIHEISTSFKCHFYHEKKGLRRYTRIRAQSEQDLLGAYQRLIGMSREMLTRKNRGIYGNFFLVPPRELYGNHIIVRRNVSNKMFTFAMDGSSPDESCEGDWTRLVQHVEVRVQRAIRDTLTTFIQNLHVSNSHVRLKINFGVLELTSFQKSQSNSNYYQTDDFLEMIQNPRTELSACHLKAKGGDMFRLFKVMKGMPQFQQPEETFIVRFDFRNATKNSGLRLETERVRGYDAGETQIRGQRWLDLEDQIESETVLNLKVVDLTQPSFVVCATCSRLADVTKITRDMKTFENTQSFISEMDDAGSFPKRRSVIPPGQKDLTTVTEVTSVKMRVRDMEGTLELQRQDTYDQLNKKDSPWPISSEWTASYYYLGWEARLDELGNISPGEDVSWSRTLSAFFPEDVKESEVLSLPPGYKRFWAEIRLIQAYLAEALSLVALSKDDETPNSV